MNSYQVIVELENIGSKSTTVRAVDEKQAGQLAMMHFDSKKKTPIAVKRVRKIG